LSNEEKERAELENCGGMIATGKAFGDKIRLASHPKTNWQKERGKQR